VPPFFIFAMLSTEVVGFVSRLGDVSMAKPKTISRKYVCASSRKYTCNRTLFQARISTLGAGTLQNGDIAYT
jgi:hypothetical protein